MIKMKFSIFSKNKKAKLIAIYDIGSASVGGALLLLEPGMKPKILYSIRKEMIFQKDLDFKRFTESMRKAVTEVSIDLQKNGLPHLKFTKFGGLVTEKVYCTIASPWYASQTRIIHVDGKNPFTVTKGKVKKLIDKEVEIFISSEKISKYDSNDKALVIEKRITQIKLNGYKTSKPFNKKAKTLEASLLISVASDKILNHITKSIQKVFLIPKIEFISFASAVTDSLRDINIDESDFLFMDISGELTDLSLVKDDVLLETVSFPIGRNNIIREVMNTLSVSKDEALSLILMYYDNTLEKTQHEKMENVFIKIERKWITLFQNVLFKLSGDFSIPSTVFFVSDKNMEKIFHDLISKEQFGQFTMTDKVFSVKPVNISFLAGLCKYSKNTNRDIFLILGALFASKIHKY